MKNPNKIQFIMVIFFLLFSVLKGGAEVVVDILSDLDRQYLEDYILFDKDKPIEEVEIIDYIAGKIRNSTGDFYVDVNSCVLIKKLENNHKIYFDDILIEFIEKRFSDNSLTYKNMLEKPIIQIAMITLGDTRTKQSIEYLFQLLRTYENWPEIFKESLATKNKKKEIEELVRYRAMGGLLDPQDEKGKELIPLIEVELNTIQDESFKSFMLDALDIWKHIYSPSCIENSWIY